MKVSELSGAQLDWAVAYIEGYAEGPNGSFWITEDGHKVGRSLSGRELRLMP
jgi:hypothetical protein